MENSIISSVVLGIVEGLTEFLPISSTGHLILVNQWFRFTDSFSILFNIIIQLGAMLAVVFFYWQKLSPFKKEVGDRKKVFIIWKKAIIGVVPALILGGLLGGIIEEKLFNPWTVAIALILGGLLLLLIEKKSYTPKYNSIEELPFKIVLLIGLIQCLAMIPGTSRSAATIIGALVLGTSRTLAVEFSFFLAIPTLLAASGYNLLTYKEIITKQEILLLGIGSVIAFVVAFVVIKFLMNYIKKHNFVPFGYYRIILGILILGYFFV